MFARVNISQTLLITPAQRVQQEPRLEPGEFGVSDDRRDKDLAWVWLCSSLAVQGEWEVEDGQESGRKSPSPGDDVMCTSTQGGITSPGKCGLFSHFMPFPKVSSKGVKVNIKQT